MMDGTHAPTEEEIAAFTDEPARAAWVKLTRFLKENYDIAPEKIFDKKQGWDVRYRKSGKTLITLTPEKTAVRVLMVLGREESEKALSMRNELSAKMYRQIEDTKQLHDGRWLWIRLFTAEDVEDIERLLPVKRKPRKAQAS
jgi:D-lyxose ketol-isomerase